MVDRLAPGKVPWDLIAEQPGCGSAGDLSDDELRRTQLLVGIEAVVFDLDGTLVDSDYDWPALRQQLGVEHGSILDNLAGLEPALRTRRLALLGAAEQRATRNARLKEGAQELLALLQERGLKTALVTNNTEENTFELLDRFRLCFAAVVTRDSGCWKPSGEPLLLAAERLAAAPAACLMVGDASLDMVAARNAGFGRACAVYGATRTCPELADLVLADLPALTRYLAVALAPVLAPVPRPG